MKPYENPRIARQEIPDYIRYYNEVRLHAAIGYVAPLDKLLGREQMIFDERDRKLEQARRSRQQRCQAQTCYTETAWTEDRAGHRPQVGRAGKRERRSSSGSKSRGRLRAARSLFALAFGLMRKTQSRKHSL